MPPASSMTPTYVLVLIAIFAGLLMPMQAAANRQMGKILGQPLHGSMVNFVVGALAIIIVLSYMRQTPSYEDLPKAPWWSWLGGLMGVTFVTASIVLAPKIGAVPFFAAMVCGQMIASMTLDATGWMHMPKSEITWTRVLGVLFVIVGVLLTTRSITSPAVTPG